VLAQAPDHERDNARRDGSASVERPRAETVAYSAAESLTRSPTAFDSISLITPRSVRGARSHEQTIAGATQIWGGRAF
jgi:hypothetical protein